MLRAYQKHAHLCTEHALHIFRINSHFRMTGRHIPSILIGLSLSPEVTTIWGADGDRITRRSLHFLYASELSELIKTIIDCTLSLKIKQSIKNNNLPNGHPFQCCWLTSGNAYCFWSLPLRELSVRSWAIPKLSFNYYWRAARLLCWDCSSQHSF